MSQHFVFDLTKSDLAYHYQQCINGIEEVRRKAWELLTDDEEEQQRHQRLLALKDKLSILKLIKECEEGKFALFKDGPSTLNVKSLEERIYQIEIRQINQG
jgi:hypothetical protein